MAGRTVAAKGEARAALAFQEALALHRQGRLDEARLLYQKALQRQPQHLHALINLGVICLQTQQPQHAIDLFGRALRTDPRNALAHNNLGNALRALAQPKEAIASYERAIALAPDHADAYFNRGAVLAELRQYEAAIASYRQAISRQPGHLSAYNNLGLALAALQQYAVAVGIYDEALAIKPDYADAANNRGIALRQLKQWAAAVASYDQAIASRPDYAEAYYNRANALYELKQYPAAIASYEQAITLNPTYTDAYHNRGLAYFELRQYQAAVSSYDEAIALRPDHTDAYNNRGNALQGLQNHQAAIESYDKALAIRPDFADAYNNRGSTLIDLKRYQDAVADFDRALALNPEFKDLYGARLIARMQICDWDGIEAALAELRDRIASRRRAAAPFPVLALVGSAALQRTAAETWMRDCFPDNPALPAIAKHSPHPRIRIGYFSADYREHATLHLMAGLFETHDRSRFELSVFSFGVPSQDPIRKRLEAACEHFVDVRNSSDQQIAVLAREKQIDIAIDLKGFTQDHRAGVFALRAAPLQVSYLGYPGTMGAPYMDYLIADHTLLPPGSESHYAEKIIYLPHSYQINDNRRSIGEQAFTRAQLGLPPAGMVFCCFNNSYKITPSTFDSWMRILKRTESSVLWLLEDNPTAAANLRREALRRGVSAQRLVFAPRVPLSEHLARHRLADLFLDTLPCNAHTTASDALWAGVPLLTCAGEAFASRVAASLLHAIDLPELITSTPEQYEEVAVVLGTEPKRLADIRQKLSNRRLTAALFDTGLSTRNLETAYSRIYQRYQADLPADHIDMQSDFATALLCNIT